MEKEKGEERGGYKAMRRMCSLYSMSVDKAQRINKNKSISRTKNPKEEIQVHKYIRNQVDITNHLRQAK